MNEALKRVAEQHPSLALFISTAVTVFLLGFQSQAVIHGYYSIAWITSMAIAAAQFVMFRGANHKDGHWIWMGIGGATGIELAMLTFRSTLL